MTRRKFAISVETKNLRLCEQKYFFKDLIENSLVVMDFISDGKSREG